jgi:hypothetical protein
VLRLEWIQGWLKAGSKNTVKKAPNGARRVLMYLLNVAKFQTLDKLKPAQNQPTKPQPFHVQINCSFISKFSNLTETEGKCQ